jgi:hypothetical protein
LQRAGAALAAEKARSAASLAAAGAAQDNTARELATEEARLLAQLSERSALRQSWVARQQTQRQKYGALIQRFGAGDTGPPPAPAQADAQCGGICQVLRQLRKEAGVTLQTLTAASVAQVFGPGMALDTEACAGHGEAVNRVRDRRARVLAEASARALREAEFRYADAAEVMNSLHALQARRLALLPQRAFKAW